MEGTKQETVRSNAAGRDALTLLAFLAVVILGGSNAVAVRFSNFELPPYAVPRFIEFREDMPLTVTEKVFKRALRQEYIEKLGLT